MSRNDFHNIKFFQDVLLSIQENLRELSGRRSFADPEELPYIEGKIMAYQEMLSMLNNSAESFGLPKHEPGL